MLERLPFRLSPPLAGLTLTLILLQGFNDPVLAQLIGETLSANHDLAAAVANYERAVALLRGAKRNQLPTAGISA